MKKLLVHIQTYLKLILLILLMTGAFSYAMFQGGFVSWFLFYSFLPISLYSFLMFLYPIRGFLVGREIDRDECRAGDSLKVVLTIKRKFPFPLFYMVIEDDLPEKLAQSGFKTKKRLIFPWIKKDFKVSYELDRIVRGEHEFETVKIKVGDLFGLLEKGASFSIKEKVLVYPSYYEIPYKQLGTQFNQGHASPTVRIQRENSTLSGVREYQPGDRFSWINWKATAKKNEIMTKEFEERKSQDVFLLLDSSPSDSFEQLVSLSASVVQSIIKRGISLGFFSPGVMDRALPIFGGEGQRQKIFTYLARVEPYDHTSLLDVFELTSQVISFHISLMFVTALINEETIETISKHKMARNMSILVLKKEKGLSKEEIKAQQAALLRGIQVKFLGESGYKDVYSEVSIR